MDIQPKDTSPGHFYVSLVKSFVRIAAGVAFIMAWAEPAAWAEPLLLPQFVGAGGFLLIIAEVLGIAEELV